MRDKKKERCLILSPKTGRPKSQNPKDYRFSIRLDDDIFQKLENYCQENNMKKSEVIRAALLKFLSAK